MIRQEIRHSIEGNLLHDLSVFIAERHYSLQRPRVELWSPERRDTFRFLEEYPGLPDLVVTKNDGCRTKHTFVVEFETKDDQKAVERKHRQFKRYGITDVIIIPLFRFKDSQNLKSLETQIVEWLP